MAPRSPAAILVRSVADERLAHGDKAFALGFAIVIGGGTLSMLAGIGLRLAGAL